jgi:hypothetical protein
MSVGIRVGSIVDEIGTPSFMHAFFSTISARCEPDGWGSRFPHLMNQLYQGHLLASHTEAALAELAVAKSELETFPPSQVVWDIENPDVQPPWGSDIADTITSLGNYFVSCGGRDLFELLEEALADAVKKRKDVIIE